MEEDLQGGWTDLRPAPSSPVSTTKSVRSKRKKQEKLDEWMELHSIERQKTSTFLIFPNIEHLFKKNI